MRGGESPFFKMTPLHYTVLFRAALDAPFNDFLEANFGQMCLEGEEYTLVDILPSPTIRHRIPISGQ